MSTILGHDSKDADALTGGGLATARKILKLDP
jgi:hypothetical protein